MPDTNVTAGATERRCPKCRAAGDVLPEPPLPGYLWVRCLRRQCRHMWIIVAPGAASSHSALGQRRDAPRPSFDGDKD